LKNPDPSLLAAWSRVRLGKKVPSLPPRSLRGPAGSCERRDPAGHVTQQQRPPWSPLDSRRDCSRCCVSAAAIILEASGGYGVGLNCWYLHRAGVSNLGSLMFWKLHLP
uniref:Uncharacterized protein n=1 Tax=Leptobrachium leishanense TaxID=445787 RepID=A0A8C5MKE1_9ANUR